MLADITKKIHAEKPSITVMANFDLSEKDVAGLKAAEKIYFRGRYYTLSDKQKEGLEVGTNRITLKEE